MNDKGAVKLTKNNNLENYTSKIFELLEHIRYGSITLVIEDGIIIQIETSEKIRLN